MRVSGLGSGVRQGIGCKLLEFQRSNVNVRLEDPRQSACTDCRDLGPRALRDPGARLRLLPREHPHPLETSPRQPQSPEPKLSNLHSSVHVHGVLAVFRVAACAMC